MNDGTSPAVHRIDPDTNEVIASVPLPGRVCQGLGASPEARIDPATNEVVDRIDARSGPGDVAVAFGSVWVTTERGEVIRLEP